MFTPDNPQWCLSRFAVGVYYARRQVARRSIWHTSKAIARSIAAQGLPALKRPERPLFARLAGASEEVKRVRRGIIGAKGERRRDIRKFNTLIGPGLVRFTSFIHLQCRPLTAWLAVYFAVVGCAAHKTAPLPPATYPATSESALRELRRLPQGSYDRLAIITIAAERGQQLASAIKGARDSAAQKGASALVILKEVEFLQKVGQRNLKVRRITYLAIRIR